MTSKGTWPGDVATWRKLRDAEASGVPFLLLSDRAGALEVVSLTEDRSPLVIGRSPSSDVAISWDERVSRTHAQLIQVGQKWSAEDEDSRNGTFVNEVRLTARRVLNDGDVIRAGKTLITFRVPGDPPSRATALESHLVPPPKMSPGQRQVLEALCRPCLATGGPHPPASNEQIGEELNMSVDAVKGQLRLLFQRFEIGDLPQIQKRTSLVRIAIMTGILRS